MQDHERLKAIRRALGLSVQDMAAKIGLNGEGAADKMRAYERGARPISGPIIKLMDYIESEIQAKNKV
jgi:transcriptional regulator with XRE-family HTH domain